MVSLKLCVDCRHYRSRDWSCIRPLSARVSPVSGKLDDRLDTYAAGERKPGRTLFTRRLRCGPDAIWFERKDDA